MCERKVEIPFFMLANARRAQVKAPQNYLADEQVIALG